MWRWWLGVGGQQPFWIMGILLITLINTTLNLAAYAFAAQSLLASVGSLALLWNLLVSKFFLREEPDKFDYIGTGISMVGVTVATVFGPHRTNDYTISKLIDLYTRALFIVFIILDAVFIAFLFLAARRNVPFRRLASAALPGMIAGLTALFSKSAVELVKSAAIGGTDFQHPVTYLIIIAAIVAAVSQLKFLNKTLQDYDPLVTVPVYNAFMLLSGALSGIVYFEEYKDLDTLDYFLFPIGVGIMLGALVFFAKRPIGDSQIIVDDEPSAGPGSTGDDPEAATGKEGSISKLREPVSIIFGSMESPKWILAISALRSQF